MGKMARKCSTDKAMPSRGGGAKPTGMPPLASPRLTSCNGKDLVGPQRMYAYQAPSMATPSELTDATSHREPARRTISLATPAFPSDNLNANLCPRAHPSNMTGDDLEKDQTRKMADALFPSINYLVRLKQRMYAKGFEPGDLFLDINGSALQHRLGYAK
jgi:hypothetical protein